MGKGTTFKQCGCRDDSTGKLLGRTCQKLRRGNGWSPVHGTWYYQLELPPHADGTRRAPLRKGGFTTKEAADTELDRARDLLAIAAPGDTGTAIRIADAITASMRDTRTLPDPEQVRTAVAGGLAPGRQAACHRRLARGMAGRQEEAAARDRAQLRRAHPPVPQAAPRAHPSRPAPGHRHRSPVRPHRRTQRRDHRGPRQPQPRPAGSRQRPPAGRPGHLPADPRHPPLGP